jgi:tetratricopeptide (TPR) repeat protein
MSNLLQLLQGTPRRPAPAAMPLPEAPATGPAAAVADQPAPAPDGVTDVVSVTREATATAPPPATDEPTLELLDGPAARTTAWRGDPRRAAPTAGAGTAQTTLAGAFSPGAASAGAGLRSGLAASGRARGLALGAVAIALALAAFLLLAGNDEPLPLAPGTDGTDPALADVDVTAAVPAGGDAGDTPAAVANRVIDDPVPPVRARRRSEPAPDPADAVAADDWTGGEDWADPPVDPATGLAPPPGAGSIRFTRTTPVASVLPELGAAFNAFQAGDYAAARATWSAVLAREPGQADALLGLAAVAARTGEPEAARAHYAEVLRADPRNATALAGMALLPATAGGPAGGDESALKVALHERPEAAELHFALGNVYVADGRWPDAQAAFFAAARHAPANADYAFNLAVSLDRLGQRAAAADHYDRALALATGSQSFDAAAARRRLAALRGPGT